ncbi:MAG: DUF5658 family protein [Acidobacteriia bacterium]|nr:DUF5658 family protein [Terriglobia bacterium]
MKYLLTIILFSALAQGQSVVATSSALPDAPGRLPFWSLEKKVSVGIFAGLVAADAITTQHGLNRGFQEANPLMRPFVTRGVAGEAAGSALGFGTGLGVVYLLHRTHHYKAERIAMQVIIGGEGFVVARNIHALR